jgi:flagellar biosynthesis chaperone FliJ
VRVRELEEEQSMAALEAALNEVRRLEAALETVERRARTGRELIRRAAETGEILDRVIGLAELQGAYQAVESLQDDLEEARARVSAAQEDFLARRVEHRQAKTLVEDALMRARVVQERRNQQETDDWHRARSLREEPLRHAAGLQVPPDKA